MLLTMLQGCTASSRNRTENAPAKRGHTGGRQLATVSQSGTGERTPEVVACRGSSSRCFVPMARESDTAGRSVAWGGVVVGWWRGGPQAAGGGEGVCERVAEQRVLPLGLQRPHPGHPTAVDALRTRLLAVLPLADDNIREAVSAVLKSWLVFVQVLCVDWLSHETCPRTQLRDACVGALLGALTPLLPDAPPSE